MTDHQIFFSSFLSCILINNHSITVFCKSEKKNPHFNFAILHLLNTSGNQPIIMLLRALKPQSQLLVPHFKTILGFFFEHKFHFFFLRTFLQVIMVSNEDEHRAYTKCAQGYTVCKQI